MAEKEAPSENLDNFDYRRVDLNKLPDEKIKAHKAAMDVKFKENTVKKGDPGFKYDKRVDFNRDPT